MNTTRVRTKGWLFDSMAFTLALASVLMLLAMVSPSHLPAFQPRQDSIAQVEAKDLVEKKELPSIGPAPIEESSQQSYGSSASASSFFRLPHTSEIAWGLLTVSVFFCGYSLITAGKKGAGWITISLLITVLAILTKLVLSMFVEVTTQYTPPDWDEE